MRASTAIILVIALIAAQGPLQGAVSLPRIFGSDMVLQRDRPVAIFGDADPGEQVRVTFGKESQQTTANAEGKWQVFLEPMAANATGQTLTVSGANTLVFDNVLVGEVWIGSGQSNMAASMSPSREAKGAQDGRADLPVRLFRVPHPGIKGADGDDSYWNWADSSDAEAKVSKVLYYFGQRVQAELGVPIGLITCAKGGSGISGWEPGGNLYTSMIEPLVPFTIRGVLWYQGEADVMRRRGLEYIDRMVSLIDGWRAAWNYPEMPFYYVHIAPWSGDKYQPGELPSLWEAQTAMLKHPHTGMAVITDTVTKMNNIHPSDKVPVGERLARWALAKTYGQDLVYSGPLFRSVTVEGQSIRVHFAHADGLTSRDQAALNEFQIAGSDGAFVDAKAIIDGETVIVSAPSVTSPTQVRLGWHNQAQPNLVNAAGLPAAPFQSNNWQGGTGE